ncbi:dienelactone hydrolase family protein [Sclerotinia borealis F-4128]|uniref:Dienelactone hydrolase family protein n=1 Tax=Sclerotinia borealis (strain F-4128) TaxID=1432307 RepID=W9C7T9_SCLBF|nr:dienelactone hydrolase family protein [Sclerotinia borealis F-4128]
MPGGTAISRLDITEDKVYQGFLTKIKAETCSTGRCFHCVLPVSNDAVLNGDIVYIAEPTAAKIKRNRGLIYFSDSSGIAPHTRALADEYARAGYLTIVINFWGRHQPIGQSKEEIVPWDRNHPTGGAPSNVDRARMVDSALDYLRLDRNCIKIGGVGYSGGVLPLMILLKESPCRLAAAFTGHPTQVRRGDYRSIHQPLSIAQTWDDRFVPEQSRHEQEAELIESVRMTDEEKVLVKSGRFRPRGCPWQINLFSGVEHGFASRLLDAGQMNINETYVKRAAFEQAVLWFETYMPDVSI